jgi:hypothetical protein
MIWRSLGQVVSGQRGWTAITLGVKAMDVLGTHLAHTLTDLSYQVPLVPAFPFCPLCDTVFEPFEKSVRLNGKGLRATNVWVE